MGEEPVERDVVDRLYWSVVTFSLSLCVGGIVYLSFKLTEM